MTTQPTPDRVGIAPLVTTFLERTMEGRVTWKPAADKETFVAAVDPEHVVRLSSDRSRAELMNALSFRGFDVGSLPHDILERPVLAVFDSQGREVFRTTPSEASVELVALYL